MSTRKVSALLGALLVTSTAHADAVNGYCERHGKRIDFTDGPAFVDARDAKGAATTAIYLTARLLDRKALAACAECKAAPGEDTFSSPRGNLVEAQRSAPANGWMEIQHSGGGLDMCLIVDLIYLADDAY